MSILLVHLSDIHTKTLTTTLKMRAQKLGESIYADLDHTTKHIVLIVSGDLVFSGSITEYEESYSFIKTIIESILSYDNSLDIIPIIVPGNHDCNFSEDQSIRDKLLVALNKDNEFTQSTIEQLLSPLNNYFDFIDTYDYSEFSINRSTSVYKLVKLNLNSRVILIHLFNSSLCSTIHENKGSLHIPLDHITIDDCKSYLSLSVIHHPTSWFSQPNSMRQLKTLLEDVSSITLTGHEHTPETHLLTKLDNKKLPNDTHLYVSGGVIQDPRDQTICTYKSIKIDTNTNTFYLSTHTLKSDYPDFFFEKSEESTITNDNNNSLINRDNNYKISSLFSSYLQDLNAPISHPKRDPRIPIDLQDLFIYPDMWELDSDIDSNHVKGSNFISYMNKHKHILITGDEKSGKTSIAKSIFLDSCKQGILPILLSGKDIPANAINLRSVIRDKFEQQYNHPKYHYYETISKSNKMIIIDDIQYMPKSNKVKNDIISELNHLSEFIILIGDDTTKLLGLNHINGETFVWEYRHLGIMGFGQYLREEFVKKWLLLETGSQAEDIEIQEVRKLCDLLNTVIKSQLIPTHPLYVLLVLQQANSPNTNIQDGNFEKLFDGLITAILNNSNITNISIPAKYSYLSNLAIEMHNQKTNFLDINTCKEWHSTYWNNIEIDVPFDSFIKDLIAQGILDEYNNNIQFKYTYFYCYFVAYYISRNIHNMHVKALISYFSKHLYHNISAEIILFLTHMSGDPEILDQMLATSKRLLSECKAANFSSDTITINNLGKEIGTIEICNSPEDNRRELQIKNDLLLNKNITASKSQMNVSPPTTDCDITQRLFDLNAAYKTIQILGQALRNIAGHETKERKEAISSEIIQLSNRILGSFFSFLSEDKLPFILEDMMKIQLDSTPDLNDNQIKNQVCKKLEGLSKYICYATIKHTSSSLYSGNLQATLHRMLKNEDEIINKFYLLSLDLESLKSFPKDDSIQLYNNMKVKNKFCADLVRIIVAHHIYLYVVPEPTRQSISSSMNISFKPSVHQKRRKISNQHSKKQQR